jgi:hypothetical protein
MLLFVAQQVKSPAQRRRRWGWWLAFLIALGLIVVGHGCHSGDHDIDNEPAITLPARQRDALDQPAPTSTTRKPE